MRKRPSYAEIYNDRWDLIVNVYRVLRDLEASAELERQIRLTPFARAEFDECTNMEIAAINDPIDRARRTIFRSFAGFGSASINADHATGFRSNSSRSGTTPAHDWANYPNHIRSFVHRLAGVTIENRSAFDVIRQHDRPETLFYCDPPYPHDVRSIKHGNDLYAHEMSDEDHRQLAEQLHSIHGMALISGYRGDLYDDLYGDWHRVDRASYADGARRRIESLWISPKAHSHLNYELPFKENRL